MGRVFASWTKMSANDCPEPAFRIVPDRRVEFSRRQIEHGVVGLVHAWDDERIYEATNAGGSPAALDVVERDVPERVVQTRVRESAAAGQLRQRRTLPAATRPRIRRSWSSDQPSAM
jgi:hypothetical protein